jgi:DNA-binding FadR family transcriptional regulator
VASRVRNRRRTRWSRTLTVVSGIPNRSARSAYGRSEHKRILAAIVDRDPDAAREAMREHLETVEGYLREYASERAKS